MRIRIGTPAVLLLLIGHGHAGAQARASDLMAFKAELALQTRGGTWWLTSNEQYANDDGGIEAYAVRHWVLPDSVSAAGCLWSVREGKVWRVHWRFFTAWDAAAGRPLYYQSGPDGSTGVGQQTYRDERVLVIEQNFGWAAGGGARQSHRTEWVDDDTHLTESATFRNGRWEPNRKYRWQRTNVGTPPCGPQT